MASLTELMGLDYKDYIRSPEWIARRSIALASAGHRCERCSAVGGLEVHHKHYRTLGAEQAEDLEVLCKLCHDVADRERERRTRAEIYEARVNGWATKKYGEDWDRYSDFDAIAEEFEEWLEDRP